MPNITNALLIPGSISSPVVISGNPSAGTNEQIILTFGGTPTGGTFTLTFDGYTTAAISWSATNATLVSNIDTALEALPNIGTSGVTTAALNMTSGIGTISVTFAGDNLAKAVSNITATSSLTGTSPTLTVTEAVAGSEPSFRGAPAGLIVVDSATGNRWTNISTTLQPLWIDAGNVTFAGTPSAGTSSVNTLTIAASTSGGSSTLTFGGLTTPSFAWNATNATLLSNIQLALDNTFGTNAFVAAAGSLTAGIGTITLTASNRLAALAIGAMTITNGFTGGSAATVSETTAGVTATYWGCAKGTVVKDTTNGKLFINTGVSRGAPTWTVVGSQT